MSPWQVFICRACGLLYDEAVGDPDSGLVPGTRFADIPDDWACPLCGVGKTDFELYVAAAPVSRGQRMAQATQTAQGTGRSGRSRRHDAGVVIVGAGRAGWQMAAALRAGDSQLPITLVTSCNGDVYDKPLLSVALARGLPLATLARESGAAAAQRLGVRLLAQTQATRVLAGSRQLRTSRGNVPYRELVLAHGAQARTLTQCPPSLCWRINHLQAYAAFRAALGTAPQHLAVIGAGLIGSELANDLALAGHGVTLLDQADRPLAAVLSPAQSQQLLSAWAALPLHFVGGVQVSALRALPAKVSVDAADAAPRRAAQRELRTTDGQVFCVDQVVLAAGLETPGRLAHSAGLAWHNGIAVQPLTLATGVAGVHALGDCIAIAGQVSRYIEPIGRQAQTIAARLLGAPAQPYLASRVPLRVKTSSLPFTL